MKDTVELSLEESMAIVERAYCEAIADKMLEQEAFRDLWLLRKNGVKLEVVPDENA